MKEKPVPGELRNVDVGFISLVDRGANKRQFKIFKSADWPENEDDIKINADDLDHISAPEGNKAEEAATVEVVKEEDQEMKGFFQTVKEFFLKRFGKVGVTKAERPTDFSQAMAAIEAEETLWRAFSTIRDVVTNILSSDLEDKAAQVSSAVDSFKAYLLGRISQIGVTKALEECRGGEVEKAGRKISAARLAALKEAHSLLAQIIAEAEADGDSGKEETGVTKEELEGVMGEVLKQVQESLKNGLAPIEERVAKLEKADEESKKALEESIKKTVEPLEQRIETIEKARGVSQSIPADGVQDKPGGTFAGVIFGRR